MAQALDQHFDFLTHGDHQVGKLIDDQNDLRQRFVIELFFLKELLACLWIKARLDTAAERFAFGGSCAHFLIETIDIARIHAAHHAIAALHFLDRPFQRADRFVRLGNDLGEQMRDVVVALQLQHLRIDQDQAAFSGREAIKQRQQDCIEANRLA